MRRTSSSWWILVALLPLAACATAKINGAPSRLPYHIVMANQAGDLIGPPLESPRTADATSASARTDCDLSGSVMHDYSHTICSQEPDKSCDQASDDEMDRHLEHIMACAPRVGGKRRLLIYVHGGLNQPDGELQRASNLSKVITEADYYPIFVNWDSSFLSSYADRLLWVRQGRYWPKIGPFFAPAYLLSDVARTVGRSFLAIGQLVKNDYEGIVYCPGWPFCREDASKVVQHLDKDIHVSPIVFNHTPVTESWTSLGSWVLTLPIQWITAPIIDSAGSAAWDVMWRRTTTLFYRDDDVDVVDGTQPLKPRGSLARFLDRLAEKISKNEPADWEVTIVGHSMGTIIANEIVRTYGDRLPITNIVYMAAACSVRDYQDTLWPFLEKARQTRPQSMPHVYHLMLHPKSEAQDMGLSWNFIYPFPRGSLLVWLDGFLTNPATALDLTAGRFTNLMRTIGSTPVKLRPYIDFRIFEHGHALQPKSHGGFGEFVRFWDSECWGTNLEPGDWETKCWCPKGTETKAGIEGTDKRCAHR